MDNETKPTTAAEMVNALNRKRHPLGALRPSIPEITGNAAEELAAERMRKHLEREARKEGRLLKLTTKAVIAPPMAAVTKATAVFSGESLSLPPGEDHGAEGGEPPASSDQPPADDLQPDETPGTVEVAPMGGDESEVDDPTPTKPKRGKK